LCRLPHRLIEHHVRDPEREVSRYMTPHSSAAQVRMRSGRPSEATASRAIVASIRSDGGDRSAELGRQVRHRGVTVDRGGVTSRDRLIVRGSHHGAGDRTSQLPSAPVSHVPDRHLDTEPLPPPPRDIRRAVPVLPLWRTVEATGVGEVERDRAGRSRLAAGAIGVTFLAGAALSAGPVGVLFLWMAVVAGWAWLAWCLTPHLPNRFAPRCREAPPDLSARRRSSAPSAVVAQAFCPSHALIE